MAGEEQARVARFKEATTRLRAEIGKVMVGQDAVVEGVIIALIAGGHALLEGVPGLGKTSLVRVLTGTDTDRLPEEKDRGITIVLGFAQLKLQGGRTCSIIDVPGHERLVRTMWLGRPGSTSVFSSWQQTKA